MDFRPIAGDRIVAHIGAELAATEPDVEAILVAATSSLSRIWPATWVALLMNTDPNTSQMSVADDGEPAMADYVDGLVASLYGSGRAPTIGLSEQAIESGGPILIPNEPFENFLKLTSPETQAYVARNPPPISVDTVSALMVPMRSGGATIGTLGLFDWRQTQPLSEDDVAWMQPVADHVALRSSMRVTARRRASWPSEWRPSAASPSRRGRARIFDSSCGPSWNRSPPGSTWMRPTSSSRPRWARSSSWRSAPVSTRRPYPTIGFRSTARCRGRMSSTHQTRTG